jgi:hypothetical protein
MLNSKKKQFEITFINEHGIPFTPPRGAGRLSSKNFKK